MCVKSTCWRNVPLTNPQNLYRAVNTFSDPIDNKLVWKASSSCGYGKLRHKGKCHAACGAGFEGNPAE